VLPDFLIIGAQRSGTTSLHSALAQHPAITMSFKREVHYFDWNFDRGIGWYRAHFPTFCARERSLRRRGEFATGEKSPYYLVDPAAPARVRSLLPEVKLIVLLRDPVTRAYSGYRKARAWGRETRSFEDALASELRQSEGPHQPFGPRGVSVEQKWRSYIARGRYAEQLGRWLEHFDREQIHVAISERYFADPVRVVGEVVEFIGLTPVAPVNVKGRTNPRYEPLSPALWGQLQAIFADDVRRLTDLLGEDPGWRELPDESAVRAQ
jgi:hypothetical protein